MKNQNINFLFLILFFSSARLFSSDDIQENISTDIFVDCKEEIIYEWAIVGAGPAGIITVGALLDTGVDPSSVIQLDPEFYVGAMGNYYGEVVSNTTVQRYFDSFHAIKSFSSPETELGLEKLKVFEPEKGCPLKYVAESLQTVSDYLRNKIVSELETVLEVERVKDYWKLHGASGTTYFARKVVLANGSHPRTLDYEQEKVVPLDDCFFAEKRAENFSPDDVVAVFGNAHSAIMIMHQLLSQGVKKIINFYRTNINDLSSVKYHYLMEDLTEDLVEWLNRVILRDPPENLISVLSCPENYDLYKDEITKIVYAIGFERNDLPIKDTSSDSEICFNDETGVIGTNLFGLGIAYPRIIPDADGQPEPQVSIPEFTKQIHKVLPGWLKN